MSFWRRRPVPDAVRAVALPPGERRVAWGTTLDGAAVVASDRALVLPGGARLEWARIEKATWRPPQLVLLETAEVEATGAQHVLPLDDPGDLPATVRARVTGSVAWSVHERLSPAGGVRVVGRRVPDEELLQWQLVYDAGTDRDDPLVRAQAESLLESARRNVG